MRSSTASLPAAAAALLLLLLLAAVAAVSGEARGRGRGSGRWSQRPGVSATTGANSTAEQKEPGSRGGKRKKNIIFQCDNVKIPTISFSAFLTHFDLFLFFSVSRVPNCHIPGKQAHFLWYKK